MNTYHFFNYTPLLPAKLKRIYKKELVLLDEIGVSEKEYATINAGKHIIFRGLPEKLILPHPHQRGEYTFSVHIGSAGSYTKEDVGKVQVAGIYIGKAQEFPQEVISLGGEETIETLLEEMNRDNEILGLEKQLTQESIITGFMLDTQRN